MLLTVGDLRTKFPQHRVVATMQCSGNRSSEMIKTGGTCTRVRVPYNGLHTCSAVSSGPTAFSGTPFEKIALGKIRVRCLPLS